MTSSYHKTLCGAATALLLSCTASAVPIDAIEVNGLTVLSRQALLNKLQSSPGTEFDPQALSQDIKTLYELGYFDDIKVEAGVVNDDFTLSFRFIERPRIAGVSFEGNNLISDEDIEQAIPVSAGDIYSPELVGKVRETLRQMYDQKGLQDVRISERSSFRERTRSYDLTFRIEEGEKTWIEEIVFEGATALDRGDFYDVIQSRQKRWYSWATDRGIFSQSAVELDAQRAEQLYFDHGYIEARVRGPELSKLEDGNYRVVYRITEGPQYDVSNIDFTGIDEDDRKALTELVELRAGDTFSAEKVRNAIEDITEFYANRGHADTLVEPQDRIDREKRTLALTFNVRRGSEYQIGAVQISGNDKTRDKVIRRQMQLLEGATYNASRIEYSRNRLQNLNYFEDIRILEHKADTDEIDLDVRVTEKPTGLFSIGAGYSSVDHLVGTLSITQGNLFGRGQYIKAMLEAGSEKTYYSLTFSEPSVLDSLYSFSGSVYNENRERDYFDEERMGGRMTVGRHLFERVRGTVTYKYEDVRIEDIDERAYEVYRDIYGSHTISSLSPTLTRNTLDNDMIPTQGMKTSTYLEWAGSPLGGTDDFYEVGLTHAQYIPLFKDFIGAYNLEIRGVDKHNDAEEVPSYERLYLGGINSLRGYTWDEVGPKNALNESEGGYSSGLLNLELLYPVTDDGKLRLVGFVDVGNVFDGELETGWDDYEKSYGGGVRWVSPMGPLRIEWGKKIDPEPGETTSRWDFTIGSMF